MIASRAFFIDAIRPLDNEFYDGKEDLLKPGDLLFFSQIKNEKFQNLQYFKQINKKNNIEIFSSSFSELHIYRMKMTNLLSC